MKIQPFRLEHYYARYEFTAKYMLSSSDAETRTLGDLLALEPDARERFDALRLGYTEVPGAPAMRDAAASIYEDFSREDVRIFSCAEECIYVTGRALLEPGDHVIVETPLFESASVIPKHTGAEVSAWERRFEDGWEHDLGALQRLIRPNTKMIYIATPSHPLGLQMRPEVFHAVMELARSRKIVVLCDEVFREYEHAGTPRLPAACELYENAISIGSMSKPYGLAGLRLGWIASRNHALLDECTEYKIYTTICSSGPSEFLSALALRHRQVILQRNLDILHRNKPLLMDFFRRHADLFELVAPNASSMCFPRMKNTDTAAFCERLVESTSVLLVPGYVYDHPDHVRFGLGRADMPEALALLESYLDEHRPQERSA